MNLVSIARIIQGADGRVRLTTKTGATFDAEIVRTEDAGKTLVVRPTAHTVTFDGYTPDTLRVIVGKLRSAERPDSPLPPPDDKALRKALAWPVELPPKSSKAARSRAARALAAATADTARAALLEAIDCNLDDGVAAVAALLPEPARHELLRTAVTRGAGRSVAALCSPDAGDVVDGLLALAAATGRLFAVRALLERGADPNAICSDAPAAGLRYPRSTVRTALHWAVANGHVEVVHALLDAGARLVDPAGLIRASAESQDVRLFELLLERGLDANTRNAAGHPMLRELGAGLHSEMLSAAIAAGADADAVYPDGSTLLLHAIDLARSKSTHTFFVKDLIEAGADPNRGRLHGRSALALAEDVPFDPGAHRDERWLARWVRDAGGHAHREPDAPELTSADPPPPPPPAWQARIDPELARAERYVVDGVTLTACRQLPEASWTASTVSAPDWGPLGGDQIAIVRAKLEHVAGAPLGRGDAYKTTFEYAFEAEIGDTTVLLHLADWKARAVHVAVAPPGPAAERAVEALWELLTIAPLAPYRDRFRFDEYARCHYRSDGSTAFADLPDLD